MEELSIAPLSYVDTNWAAITKYVPKDNSYVLHTGLFKNMDDDDMVKLAKLMEVKTPDNERGGWVINTKRRQLNNIKWDPIKKTYIITFTRQINKRLTFYETHTTTNMKYLAIYLPDLYKYKSLK